MRQSDGSTTGNLPRQRRRHRRSRCRAECHRPPRHRRPGRAQGSGRVVLPIGYFANVIELDGKGIAICTDGVGTKTIIATMMGKFDTIGIDCVAMNVNDMICVGARPVSLGGLHRHRSRRRDDARRRGEGAVRRRPHGGRVDLRWRDRATQGHRERFRPRRHGHRPRRSRQGHLRPGRAAWRYRDRGAQQRHSQQRIVAGAARIFRTPQLSRRSSLRRARRRRSARSCSVRPPSMFPRRWTSWAACKA